MGEPERPEENPLLWQFLKHVAMGPALRVLGRPFAEGVDNIPETGGVILASNHLAVVDSFYLGLMTKRPICYLAKQEYFEGKGTRGAVVRWAFTNLNQIPVDRADGEQADASLKAAARVVEEGRVWGVYPEGTRSPDGRLYKGRTGVARVAALTGAPVVPVAMIGTREAHPPGHRFVRFHKVGMRFGEPMQFADTGKEPAREELRAFTDQVMKELQRLGGQEYADEYAPRSTHKRGVFG
ncbi:1-acyl-sn-glycerol-3-phosphate acyltransferase [Nocardioides mangrovicus]|uniref:1-acyl-sn-glycerol-3-phosphate acyltransferase n=1 Tax=Nocardioides mangrovicus TaxID=2478913 RepID=A0A3L8P0F2_9ACTN|nr:lysophospholipid acyltransferase family protein [Nocardioides mangrovicus]RLV48059.1 1-acyl-sn-glycerol-3-phosphate acyltransferase [Nocardioides mangrovicus]